MLLIKVSDNWADEMDLEGCFLTTKEEWAKYMRAVEEYEGELSVSVGSNQSIEYETADEYFDSFTEQPVTLEEAATLQRLLGLRVGTFYEAHDYFTLSCSAFGEHLITEWCTE